MAPVTLKFVWMYAQDLRMFGALSRKNYRTNLAAIWIPFIIKIGGL